jgi:hypothetical protein
MPEACDESWPGAAETVLEGRGRGRRHAPWEAPQAKAAVCTSSCLASARPEFNPSTTKKKKRKRKKERAREERKKKSCI